jgi:hypothetical protein
MTPHPLPKKNGSQITRRTTRRKSGMTRKNMKSDHRLMIWLSVPFAVALAQILYHDRAQPAGRVSYEGSGYRVRESLDHRFDWDLFVDTVTEATPAREQNEVAKYCYYTAIVIGKDFAGEAGLLGGTSRWVMTIHPPEQAKDRPANAPSTNPSAADMRGSGKWRTWTTADGRFRVDAKFVRSSSDTVTLEKQDGTTVDVSLEILCDEDRDFIRKRRPK